MTIWAHADPSSNKKRADVARFFRPTGGLALAALLSDPACTLLRTQSLLGEIRHDVLFIDAERGRGPRRDQVLLDLCHEISCVVSHPVILSLMRCFEKRRP